ncbi:Thioredoxin [Staphylococcus aureus]|uniref:Thioredoxin n=1 Tax=Staphylococcus aureus TaxID=1280 RepID=A0A2X2K2X5_STAAU|nr:Thioredoxin [Staphylococcus aureus]
MAIVKVTDADFDSKVESGVQLVDFLGNMVWSM